MEKSKSKYFLKVMADYCSSGIWDQNNDGVMTYLRDHISQNAEVLELENEIQAWNDYYDKNVKYDGPTLNFNWDNFHEEGIRLAKKLKKIMGSSGKIIYYKESEHSSNISSEEILIED